ncbi:PREDICTED: UPF0481 protein At3g47200-like [Ipomoea nil]|uniref:UPF0481 protein At3g47200-like n=1 Tax=Ipomoea nil TaxID=35883 RepID=UPI00090148AE|nr:PREDICTED: UPF0481 protein At3g47200-like [Ipomoea nil]
MSSSAEDVYQNWVIKINDELEAARRRDSDVNAEKEQWGKRSIYRIPASFTDVNQKAYKPQAVSFGPYHHGEEHLKPMEVHKHRALVRFLRRSGKPLQHYLHSLEPLLQDLKDAYDTTTTHQVEEDERINSVGGQFLQLMILDGCFMLEILRTGAGSPKYCLGKDDYAPNDPVFSDHGKLYVIPHLRRDMLVLQNQLPMLLLYTLHAVANNGHNMHVDVEGSVEFMNDLIIKIWNPNNFDPKKKLGKCLHVLDLYRKNLLWEQDKYYRKRQKNVNKMRGAREAARRRHGHKARGGDDQIIRSATELYEAGIRFKKSKTQSLADISFRSGVLRLPPITVDDTSESMFLNLIAFERSHFGAGNEVTSYISFMDNIIDSSKDVSLLHSSGIIQNAIGSDKAVAKLFNSLSKDTTMDPESSLDLVQNKVSEYCQKPWNEWRANLIHTYFRSPWAILSVIAAIFLFALTIVQTVYTVLPYYNHSNS